MQQILQWFCKDGLEKGGQGTSHFTKKETARGKGTDGSKDIVVSSHCEGSQRSNRFEGRKFDVKKLKSFVLLCRRDIAKSCFYSTVNIKSPRTQGFDNMQQLWIQKMKKEDVAKGTRTVGQKAGSSSVHTGTKVLPITDATFVEHCMKHDKKNMLKEASKTKVKSRMKELLRWAMAAKPEKEGKSMSSKVLHMQTRGLKAIPCDDQASIDSPKISFSREVERCSTVSSADSSVSAASSLNNCSIALNSTAIHEIHHCYPKKGSWITTDSECKALFPILQN